MTERIPAEISMLSLVYLHDRKHTDRSNHVKYCLHACCTYMTKAYGGGSSSIVVVVVVVVVGGGVVVVVLIVAVVAVAVVVVVVVWGGVSFGGG